MEKKVENMDFVTIDGLLSYAEAIAQRPPVEGADPPPTVLPVVDRPQRAQQAMAAIKGLVERARNEFVTAGAYREARQAVIQQECGGDEFVFFAAWNQLLARGELAALLRAPIGATKTWLYA